jgi:hypothetical protein
MYDSRLERSEDIVKVTLSWMTQKVVLLFTLDVSKAVVSLWPTVYRPDEDMIAPAAGRLRLKDDITLSWFFLIQNKFFLSICWRACWRVLAISLLFLPFYDCTVFLPSKSLLNVSCHFGIN